jgi:hypothetical protein
MAYHDRRAAALVAALAFVACTPAGPVPRVDGGPPANTLVEIEGTRLVFTDPQGRLRWELRARAVAVDRGGRVSASAPQGRLVTEDGTQVEVRADQAVYVRGSGTVELRGRVMVRAAADRWVSAGRIRYEPGADRLVATGGVRVRVREWTAWAQRLEAEPGLRRARFEGSVRVRQAEETR